MVLIILFINIVINKEEKFRCTPLINVSVKQSFSIMFITELKGLLSEGFP